MSLFREKCLLVSCFSIVFVTAGCVSKAGNNMSNESQRVSHGPALALHIRMLSLKTHVKPYVLSIVIEVHNQSNKPLVIPFGPFPKLAGDVGLDVLLERDGKWTSIADAIKLGENWAAEESVRGGESITRKFSVLLDSKEMTKGLKEGAPVKVKMIGYRDEERYWRGSLESMPVKLDGRDSMDAGAVAESQDKVAGSEAKREAKQGDDEERKGLKDEAK